MQLTWRRHKVLDLLSKGHSQVEISAILHVDESIISRDVSYLRKQSKEKIKKYIDEKLPEEYEKCLTGLNSILKETWNISQNTQDNREKVQALSLAKECYSMRLDLLTNATVVNDVMRFISSSNINHISTQSNTKKGSSTEEKIVSQNSNESKDKDKTIDAKTENNNIIENKENDIQRFTENNNSAGKSTYNSVF
jgi:hypothetical protein